MAHIIGHDNLETVARLVTHIRQGAARQVDGLAIHHVERLVNDAHLADAYRQAQAELLELGIGNAVGRRERLDIRLEQQRNTKGIARTGHHTLDGVALDQAPPESLIVTGGTVKQGFQPSRQPDQGLAGQ